MVEMEELAPGIIVYSNVIPEHELLIKNIQEVLETGIINWDPPRIVKDGKDEVDYDVRKLDCLAITYELAKEIIQYPHDPVEAFKNSLGNIFYKNLTPLEEEYKNYFAFETSWHDIYNILKYEKGHFFINHLDDCQQYHRRVSCVYYLNDDYEGGEIEFPRFNLKYKPKANELLLFPSGYSYNHSVHEIIKGTRYSVVSWLR